MTYLGSGEVSARLRATQDQQVMPLGATRCTVIADLALTGGAYTLYQLELSAGGGGAAAHFHRTFTESFQVLSGEFEVYDGQRWARGRAGDHLVVPPGGVHGFRGAPESPGTVLMFSTPGIAREDYFAELLEVATSGRQLGVEQWRDLYARHDQYMV